VVNREKRSNQLPNRSLITVDSAANTTNIYLYVRARRTVCGCARAAMNMETGC
jgi:hypothetical protein